MDQTNKNGRSKHYRSFWPLVLIAVAAFICGGLVTWLAYNNMLQDEVDSLVPQINENTKNAAINNKYYSSMEKSCEGAQGESCCLQSVVAMKSRGASLASAGKCADGEKVSRLSCAGSLEWCEPITK